jgi:bacteriocin-like protein
METIMTAEKQGKTSKQDPKRSEPVAKTTKKDETELSEKELARTTGGTGQRLHKPMQ